MDASSATEADVEAAIALASEAHRGQADKAGAPYIFHVLRVMLTTDGGEVARMAAVLHDVVEDADVTLDDLRELGFPADVVRAVDGVTRCEDETYQAFVERAGRHPVSRAVKIADLRDNLDLSPIPQPTDRDRARLERYRRALQALGAGDSA